MMIFQSRAINLRLQFCKVRFDRRAHTQRQRLQQVIIANGDVQRGAHREQLWRDAAGMMS